MHEVTEHLLVAIALALLLIIGTNAIYGYLNSNAPLLAERDEEMAYGYLKAIRKIVGSNPDDIARLSPEFKNNVPTDYISYDLLKAQLKSDKAFRISYHPPLSVGLDYAGGVADITVTDSISGGVKSNAIVELIGLEEGSILRKFNSTTDSEGKARFELSFSPKILTCFAHEGPIAGFAVLGANKEANAYVKANIVHTNKSLTNAWLVAKDAIKELPFQDGTSALPNNRNPPFLVILWDGSSYSYITYPHLPNDYGSAIKGQVKLWTTEWIGGSPFLVEFSYGGL